MGWIELLTPAVGFAVSALCLVRWKGSGVDPGSVLVDLGRTQGREAAWGTLFLLSSLGVVGLVLSRLPPPGHGGSGVIEALFWAWIVFVWAIQSLIDGSAQTRLTERGVQFGRQFLAWERIESWQWKDGVGKRLVLSLKKDGTVTVLWGRLKMSLSVPAGQETAVEQVLAEHCPASNTAPAREADGGQP